MVYYPKPMHLQTAFAGTCHSEEAKGRRRNLSLCPVATSLCNRVLSLPMHPYLTEEDIRIVCTAIQKALA